MPSRDIKPTNESMMHSQNTHRGSFTNVFTIWQITVLSRRITLDIKWNEHKNCWLGIFLTITWASGSWGVPVDGGWEIRPWRRCTNFHLSDLVFPWWGAMKCLQAPLSITRWRLECQCLLPHLPSLYPTYNRQIDFFHDSWLRTLERILIFACSVETPLRSMTEAAVYMYHWII